ncbi:isthmin-2 isoform X2 [Amia ocellicauda]|uniref:isthmin-2 isoform X2 n=1 Tax=Amia ocellicauda TaxID=2972642 RepID=UPI003463F097
MPRVRGTAPWLLWLAVLTLLLVLGKGFPAKKPKSSPPRARGGTSVQAKIQTASRAAQPGREVMQLNNQVKSWKRSLPPAPRRHKRRYSGQRLGDVQSQPRSDTEETKPFILDLKNFPDLANADLNSQNPNIQVTIEVVDDPQTEMEMDLLKESRNDWSLSSVDWLGNKKLFWPLFWEYPDSGEDGTGTMSLEDTEDDYAFEYDSEESVLSGVGRDWDGRWNKGWDSKDNYEYDEEDEWSAWSPCSVTCGSGNQKRVRSCGYACTATESRSCDLSRCADDMNAVTDLMPYDTENGTELFDADVDSCEKWLNCKSDFLQKYLHQVLTELPSCPCSYPSEVVYSAVNIFDEKLKKTYRWRDASGPKERLDIYKPTARFCVRSMLSFDSTTLAAQHCCYNDHMRLITRGKGAGAPNLISTEFSPELHYKVDVLPWILCKGDWSRFHAVRPPNNGLQCAENPAEDVYMNELEEAREY